MNLLRRTFVCPHCFERSALHDIKFRCDNVPGHCAPEPDTVLTDFLGTAATLTQKVVKTQPPTNILEKLKNWLFIPN
ncbi:MAG: hypothetical protein VSS52_000045, partial [Thiotrichaceae bacterium]|nr:hypothetical protein [Thiotrichaceae bacterium]